MGAIILRGMQAAFIVTSAINARSGMFAPEERLRDTIGTIDSIRQRVPDAAIHLLDMCGDGLQPAQARVLSPAVTRLFDYSGLHDVQAIYKAPNPDVVKNLTEMTCFQHFLHSQEALLDGVDRIFKLSGRYRLDERFCIGDYGDPGYRGQMVFSGRYASQFAPEVTGNDAADNFQLMSRLWSFDACLLPVVRSAYGQMIERMVERLNAGGYVDIEHLLHRYMPRARIAIRTPIGVSGRLAPNAREISD
ncbi:hypothetical protein [Variovorax sp. dw_954]|uniref:hypothetical protein n=1 Tax=Variovorax sp. dw_954 TaxID=2720078 RepID=UPI001BD2BEE0|nr:hypothetical protein [Variovorax sp. dw_954]